MDWNSIRFGIGIWCLIFLCITIEQNNAKRKTFSHNEMCLHCLSIVDEYLVASNAGKNDDYLKNIVRQYCPVMGENNPDVCNDEVEIYFPTIKYITENQSNLSAKYMCQNLLQKQQSCQFVDTPLAQWQIEMEPLNASALAPKVETAQPALTDLRILQVSDFHYDPLYREGAAAVCDEPVCCRHLPSESSQADGDAILAGYWGSYKRCDMPMRTIQSAFSHIAQTHQDIDVMYITGDYVDHSTWRASWKHNFRAINSVFAQIEAAFPNVPKYPLIGNHEPAPFNNYAPPEVTQTNVSTLPLYDYLIDQWTWLPKKAKKTLRTGGYYTLLIRPGLRLIALNNNICIVRNLWIYYDQQYFQQPLQWLYDTLLKAEQRGEKVHILGHVPTGSPTCQQKWAKEYGRVVERFYQTISAQFNGHTHRDQFNLFFGKKNPFVPINVAWNGGSISAWKKVNPNYRIYSVNSQDFQVTDIDTWIFNLTEANANPQIPPNWFLEYSFHAQYQMTDLSPASLYNLTIRFTQNHSLLQQYWRHFVKQGDAALNSGCKKSCLLQELCNIVTTEYADNNKRCKYLTAQFKANKPPKSSSVVASIEMNVDLPEPLDSDDELTLPVLPTAATKKPKKNRKHKKKKKLKAAAENYNSN